MILELFFFFGGGGGASDSTISVPNAGMITAEDRDFESARAQPSTL